MGLKLIELINTYCRTAYNMNRSKNTVFGLEIFTSHTVKILNLTNRFEYDFYNDRLFLEISLVSNRAVGKVLYSFPLKIFRFGTTTDVVLFSCFYFRIQTNAAADVGGCCCRVDY